MIKKLNLKVIDNLIIIDIYLIYNLVKIRLNKLVIQFI